MSFSSDKKPLKYLEKSEEKGNASVQVTNQGNDNCILQTAKRVVSGKDLSVSEAKLQR